MHRAVGAFLIHTMSPFHFLTHSAASAGALEFMTIYSTSNLPKLLNIAQEDGWRVLGAAADVPDGAKDVSGGSSNTASTAGVATDSDWDLGGMEEEDECGDEENNEDVDNNSQQQEQQCLNLQSVEMGSPTILVLGSEGRGLRTLVARACTGFVSIPGGGVAAGGSDTTQAGVDSLNVSVTGGILLWHFLSKQ